MYDKCSIYILICWPDTSKTIFNFFMGFCNMFVVQLFLSSFMHINGMSLNHRSKIFIKNSVFLVLNFMLFCCFFWQHFKFHYVLISDSFSKTFLINLLEFLNVDFCPILSIWMYSFYFNTQNKKIN